jgi:hypothetical protein
MAPAALPHRWLLLHWLVLLVATLQLGLSYIRAAWYYKRRFWSDLNLPDPVALTPKEKKRLRHYFFGTTYLSAVFDILRGKTRTRQEQKTFANLAALAGFFDDLADGGLPAPITREQTACPDYSGADSLPRLLGGGGEVLESYGKMNDPRGVALHLLHQIYRELPAQDPEPFKNYLHQVFEVETVSKRLDCNLTELQHTTGMKGGYSVLLFRSLLNPAPDDKEREAIFGFGALVQLCDDIFDVWFDRQANIQTIPRVLLESGKISELAEYFEAQVLSVKTTFLACNGNRSYVFTATSWGIVCFLVAVTRVCLQHYTDLTKKHGNLQPDDRANMVVDMATFRNKWRAAWQLIRNQPLQA